MLDSLLRRVLLLIEPVGFAWLCLLVLTVALFRKRRWKSAVLCTFVVILITLFGSTGFPGALLASLERPYSGLKIDTLPACDAVVVLGGGAFPSLYEVGGVHFTQGGDRVVMGLELIRLGKAPVLVLGGGAAEVDGAMLSEADKLQTLLDERRLVAAPVEIVSLGVNANTREEAMRVLKLGEARGWKRVLLVTSAYHMRRASAVFQTAGVVVTPAACNFLTEVGTPPSTPGWNFPTWHGFSTMSVWIHEQAGWWMYRAHGWIDPAKVAIP